MSETNKFSINKRNNGKVECIDISGYLDAHTAPELENAIKETIDNGNIRILVNFKDLDYISSAGLGVFMAFIEDVRSDGGDIKMAEMKEKVYSVFDLLGFPMLFEIARKEEEALKGFEKISSGNDG